MRRLRQVMMGLAMVLLGCGDQRVPAEPAIDATTVDSALVDTTWACPGLATCVGDVCTLAPELIDEAVTQLGRIETALRAAYARDGHFPIQTATATPGATCCAAGCVALCPANPAAWAGVVAWDTLGFSIATAHAFVYSYTGADGRTVQVVAAADLDCDTVMINVTLNCSSPGGVPACELLRPALLD